jgi:nucleotide-binding universal stress UspA family protein
MNENTPKVAIEMPKFHLTRIMVPVDFSAPSRKALHYAVALAAHFHAEVHVLHVFEQIANPADVGFSPLIWTDLEEEQQKELDTKLKAEAEAAGATTLNVRCETHVKCGRAWQEITDHAEALGVELLVLSTHGYTGLKHVLLGSVAEKVVRHAPCPVLTVRMDEKEFVE